MLEFYNIKHPKARKEHVCDLCGSKILPGQVYERYSGKYDGDLFDLKYCLDCEKTIYAFLDENGYDEYSDDDNYKHEQTNTENVKGTRFCKYLSVGINLVISILYYYKASMKSRRKNGLL